MTTAMRSSTLETIGLGKVFDIFAKQAMPATLPGLVDEVFGPANKRGALVVSGANGIVGAGKIMQFGSRLEPFGIPIAALDFPGAANGIGQQYQGLVQAFGREQAAAVMANVVQLTYDGKNLPSILSKLEPKFLLEAVPEVLEIKKAHYGVFQNAFPDIEIRSVTSGFPQSELGVGVTHPAFPHQINKVFEIVEPTPSAITKLLWALGLLPMRVSDHWSFVLDVLFCGLTQAALRYHDATNMPYWKVDKFVRRLIGPNPFRAHDAIGAKGANFLTWSCLHHLGEHYGGLFEPSASLVERKDNGQDWYPMNHFRPLVNWALDDQGDEQLRTWILGPLFQMTALMMTEERSHPTTMNAIGELCAQFVQGTPALLRRTGADEAIRLVEAYHEVFPAAASSPWQPAVFEQLASPAWQQLYVNAEHDGTVGVISISRESYNSDVDAELNRAIDYLVAAGIERVILTGDFHLSTQMVGADTTEFYPAMEDPERGVEIARTWSVTARRLHEEFRVSVGLINGKRCLGGMLELMMHCRFLVSVDSAKLGMPEVTLPVVPGMEGCHWPFRKTTSENWGRLHSLLLEGKPVAAPDGVGWLLDYAGSLDDVIRVSWKLAKGEAGTIAERELRRDRLEGVSAAIPRLEESLDSAARRAMIDTIKDACGVTLADALEIQARHSGHFMVTPACRRGVIGSMWKKTTAI